MMLFLSTVPLCCSPNYFCLQWQNLTFWNNVRSFLIKFCGFCFVLFCFRGNVLPLFRGKGGVLWPLARSWHGRSGTALLILGLCSKLLFTIVRRLGSKLWLTITSRLGSKLWLNITRRLGSKLWLTITRRLWSILMPWILDSGNCNGAWCCPLWMVVNDSPRPIVWPHTHVYTNAYTYSTASQTPYHDSNDRGRGKFRTTRCVVVATILPIVAPRWGTKPNITVFPTSYDGQVYNEQIREES